MKSAYLEEKLLKPYTVQHLNGYVDKSMKAE